MVARIRKHSRPHLYISEWMEHLGLSDERLGERMNVSRTTVWRWRMEQHRLNPQKTADIAHAMGLDNWQDLTRPPARPSVDAILAQADDASYEQVLSLAKHLVSRAS